MTDPSLRIVQLFNRYLNYGGEERSVGRIAEDLEAAGHGVTRFWHASAEWRGPGAPSRWRQALLMLRNRAVLTELERRHREEPANLWIAHSIIPVISLGVYGLARRLGVPFIQFLHNYRPISPGGELMAGRTFLKPESRWIGLRESLAGSWNGRLATSLLTLGYRRLGWNGDFASVAGWVAVSQEVKRIFSRAGWYPDRLHALPHSWHIETRAADDRDEAFFLFLGRMVEAKGVRFVVELWSRPELRGTRLVMAGEGPLADALRPGTPPNIEWQGFVSGEAKRDLIGRCRAVVFPSLWPEPLSTVAYEAYQAGKPVLASALGGMPEVVLDGVTGRLLPPANAEAWLAAIQAMSAETAHPLGLEGRRWLEENTSPTAWARRFASIAEAALRVSSASGGPAVRPGIPAKS